MRNQPKKVLNVDIDHLLSSRKDFDDFVYTPIEEAVIELKRRWEDSSIPFPDFVPEAMKNNPRALLYVCLITPNYQIRRYVELSKKFGLDPLIFEQKKDKFTSNNEWKHSLGKLRLFLGKDKHNKSRIEFLSAVDFNHANGKSVSSVETISGQSLVDFHHDLFFKEFPQLTEKNIFDASDWLIEHGNNPKGYYCSFLSLLIKNGIQFENFMINEKESFFTREIFLPAFIHVYEETGLKPLIVALEPTDTEDDEYWISYPHEEKSFIAEKLHGRK
jgi:hypothetical protein